MTTMQKPVLTHTMRHEKSGHTLLQHLLYLSLQPATLFESSQNVPFCQQMHVLQFIHAFNKSCQFASAFLSNDVRIVQSTHAFNQTWKWTSAPEFVLPDACPLIYYDYHSDVSAAEVCLIKCCKHCICCANAKHNLRSCQAHLAPHIGCSAPAGEPNPAWDQTISLALVTHGRTMQAHQDACWCPEVCSRRMLIFVFHDAKAGQTHSTRFVCTPQNQAWWLSVIARLRPQDHTRNLNRESLRAKQTWP